MHEAGVYAGARGLADVRVTAVADPGPAAITVEAVVHARFDAR
ncbi:hypothetical protein [Georgenia yuyongxinii]